MDNTDKIVLAVGGVGVITVGYILYKHLSGGGSVPSASASMNAANMGTQQLPPAAYQAPPTYQPSPEALQRDFKYNQERLVLLGYSLAPYGADGKPGQTTTKQIKAFQAKEGLPQTGVFDAVTVERLKLRTEAAGLIAPSVLAAREKTTTYGKTVVGPDGKVYIPTEGGGI